MNTYKLTNRRVDLDVYSEATVFYTTTPTVQRAFLKGNGQITPARLKKAYQCQQLIGVELAQDDGFICRVVLGKLNKQEESEWISRISRPLRIQDDTLIIAAGAEYLRGAKPEENTQLALSVPSGEYAVHIYSHLPGVNGDHEFPKSEPWQGYVDYFRATRPRKKTPDWLSLLAAEDVDGPASNGSGSNTGDWEDDERVGFLVQLVQDETLAAISPIHRGFALPIETRCPEKCPLGIEPVILSDAPEEEDEEQVYGFKLWTEKEERAHVKHMRTFKDLVATQRFEQADQWLSAGLALQLPQGIEGFIRQAYKGKSIDDVTFGVSGPVAQVSNSDATKSWARKRTAFVDKSLAGMDGRCSWFEMALVLWIGDFKSVKNFEALVMGDLPDAKIVAIRKC